MKAAFNKQKLISAIMPALGCISTKNTYPALEGIMLDCKDDKCTVTTYDLEKGYRTEIACEVAESGCYIINAQKLCQIVRIMPGSTVNIDVEGKGQVSIYSNKSRFELHAINGSEFPSLPSLKGNEGFNISASEFRKMLGRISFAIAQNSMRPELNGAYFNISDNHIVAVGCDGSRLALSEKDCEIENASEDDSKELEMEFIVPGKTLSELVKLIPDEEDAKVGIFLTRKHVIFEVENIVFFSRLIENDYIDYERFIPKNNNIKVRIDRESLLESLERAILVTEDKSMGQVKNKLRCNFTGDMLTISSKSLTNKITDELSVDKSGDDIEIGFNCRNLVDAVRACNFEKLLLSLCSPITSMLIEPEEKDEEGRFEFLVLPLKLGD